MRIVKEWIGYCNQTEVNPRSLVETKHNKWWAACACQDDDGLWQVHSLFAGLGNKPLENIERYTKAGKRELLTEPRALALLDELVREKTGGRKGYVPVAFDVPFGSPEQVMIPSFVQILQPVAGRAAEQPWWLLLSGDGRTSTEEAPSDAVRPLAIQALRKRGDGLRALSCASCGAENVAETRFCTSCGRELASPVPPAAGSPAAGEEGQEEEAQERGQVSPPSAEPGAGAEVTTMLPVAPLTVHRAILKHRYRLIQQLGTGQYGTNYRGKDIRGGIRAVLIRQIEGVAITGGLDVLTRLSALTSRHIPHVVDIFPDAGRWFLVTEDLEGEPLSTVMGRRKGPFPARQVLQQGIALCTLIEDLWRPGSPPLVYALHPLHLYLTAAGRLYLGEFAVAASGEGEPDAGQSRVGLCSDIRAAGTLLYGLLTRQLPPSARPATGIPRSGPPSPGRRTDDDLSAFLVRMARAEETDAPADLEEIRQHFRRFLSVAERAAY
jgi:hypothetical protein